MRVILERNMRKIGGNLENLRKIPGRTTDKIPRGTSRDFPELLSEKTSAQKYREKLLKSHPGK